MAKQKKNSNYVTEKTEKAKAEKEAEKIKKKQTETLKTVAFWCGCALIIIAAVALLLLAVGAFDYTPETTYHATLNMSDGSSLHFELYGNDAPKTVEHFIGLCQRGYLNGFEFLSLLNGVMVMGDENPNGGSNGVKGEFEANGVENDVPMKKGTICLARGDGYDSGYGQFLILTKNVSSLRGNYAAFGRISDTSSLDAFIKKCTIDKDGNITDGPHIVNVSLHEAHD